MEVDGAELDAQLLQQFGALGTSDRDVLVAELRALLGGAPSVETCAFFLDMNNWNLPAAVCAYFEYHAPPPQPPLLGPVVLALPQMALVGDVTAGGSGEAFPPCARFARTWRLRNTGSRPWPLGCQIRLVAGDARLSPVCEPVEALGPGACADVTVTMTSPPDEGIHQAEWRITTPAGMPFGESIWMAVQVEHGACAPFVNSAANQTMVFDVDLTRMSRLDPENMSLRQRPQSSSLPSSPRRHGNGEEGMCSMQNGAGGSLEDAMHRTRCHLFLTPNNSPSKTIGASRAALHQQNQQHDQQQENESANNVDIDM